MPLPTNPMLTALQEEFLNSPQGGTSAFSHLFGNLFQSPNQNLAKYARGLQGQYEDDYLGAILNDPNLTRLQYWGGKNPAADFMRLAPSQRGLSPGAFAPKIKYGYGVGW